MAARRWATDELQGLVALMLDPETVLSEELKERIETRGKEEAERLAVTLTPVIRDFLIEYGGHPGILVSVLAASSREMASFMELPGESWVRLVLAFREGVPKSNDTHHG